MNFKRIAILTFLAIGFYLLVSNSVVYTSAAAFIVDKFRNAYSALVTGVTKDV